MPLPRIDSEEQRLAKLSSDLRTAVDDADLALQHVFSSHLILAGAGHVEKSVIHILSEYGRQNGNAEIRRFVEKSVSRNNSLNCEKIKKILDLFNASWWGQLEAGTSNDVRDSVDSLKTLRDQIAHGHRNGTGFTVVNGYYLHSRDFVRALSLVVLAH